ncbi:MAG: LD-carboxypeptidase [Flavobacteriales bacterium]
MKRRSFLKSTLALSTLSVLPNNLRAEEHRISSQEEPRSPLRPARLSKGDTIAIMGMAGAMRDPKILTGFIQVMEQQGFMVSVGQTVNKTYGYLSGSDEDRANEFNDFVSNPLIKAIFFVKGGWGCARVLDKIDYVQLQNNPKVILGFSDITSLINAIYHKTGLITFHGPVGNSSWEQFSLTSFQELVCRGGSSFQKPETNQLQPWSTWKNGQAAGELIGGNLTVFCSLLGTPYLPSCDGKILFLEETHEEPYSIDRMLNSLRLAGVFNQISGLIFGQFNDCKAEKPLESFSLEEVVRHQLNGYSFPVIWGAPIGHVKDKWTVPIGAHVVMNADELSLELIRPAVS